MAEPTPDPSLLGRMYLLLSAALRHPVISADDALLPDELHGRRKGNPKLVGTTFAQAHRLRWIVPAPAAPGVRVSKKSARGRRARGLVELWTRSEFTAAALKLVERKLARRPPPRDLFDLLDPDGGPDPGPAA